MLDSSLCITRETEFYQGYIRFKMAVTNESTYVVTDVTLDFNFDEDLLRIDRHEPNYPVKRDKFVIGNIDAGNSKSIAIYFDPLMCSKGTDINCHVTYKDYLGKLNAVFMEPKEISTVCPIMQTDSDINVGMLKDLIDVLPSRDSRVYEIQSGFNLKKLANLACEVLQKHDVRHIRTLHTRDEKTCEIWYYGKTKVTKNNVVIKVSILAEHQTMEMFAATQSAEALTGLLAEVGRELKQIVESRASGKGKVVNVSITDSVIQRSNLLDMCDMDGNCDVNIVIEDSVVQRSNIAYVDEEARLRREQEKRAEAERLHREEELKAQEAARLKAAREKEERALRRKEEQKKELEAAEESRKKVEEEHHTPKPAPVKSQVSPVSEAQKPASATVKQTGVPVNEPTATRKLLFIPVLIIIVIAAYWMFSPMIANNETTAATVSTQVGLETYTNSIGMEFVLIPAGEFKMGTPTGEENWDENEGPVHKVTIEKAYYLGKYEVTQEQWFNVMGNKPSYFDGDNNPVEQVSWNDVQEFVNKLNEKEGTDKYRLPSEAEWEYACRAGTTTTYSFGDRVSDLYEYTWWNGNSGEETHPVGQKKTNSWGLYDMHGNVWEWCQDTWHDNYKGAPTDGSVWEEGSSSSRTLRGGSWGDVAKSCRSANRSYFHQEHGRNSIGFRLLKEVQ